MFTSIPMIFRIVNICHRSICKRNTCEAKCAALRLHLERFRRFQLLIVYMLLTSHTKVLLLCIRCLIGKAHLFTYIHNSWNKTTVDMIISFKLVWDLRFSCLAFNAFIQTNNMVWYDASFLSHPVRLVPASCFSTLQ